MKNIKLVGFMEMSDIKEFKYDVSMKPIYATKAGVERSLAGYEDLDIRSVILNFRIGKKTKARTKR